MIFLSELSNFLTSPPQRFNELSSLASSPTASALAGIFTTRTALNKIDNLDSENISAFKLDDQYSKGVRIPSPFTFLIINTDMITRPEAAQAAFIEIIGILDCFETASKPLLTLYTNASSHLDTLLSSLIHVNLSTKDILEILIAHPPHGVLLGFVRKPAANGVFTKLPD